MIKFLVFFAIFCGSLYPQGIIGSPCHGTYLTPNLIYNQNSNGEVYLYLYSKYPVFGYANVGISDRSFKQWPLPYDLSPLGITGCSIYCSAERADLIFNQNPFYTLKYTFPPLLSIIGKHFYFQVVLQGPYPNPWGISTSNAVDILIL